MSSSRLHLLASSPSLLALALAAACTDPSPEGPTTADPDDTSAGLTETTLDPDATQGTGTTVDPDDTGSSTTGPVPTCGNGALDVEEECDGTELGDATCEVLGFDGGTLACDAACVHDTSGCLDVPAVPVLELQLMPVKRFDFSWESIPGAEYYQLLESTAPGEPYVQLGTDVLGTSVPFSMPLHFRWEASYVLRACNDLGCSESEPVAVPDGLVEAVGYVKASNSGIFDDFGLSVALSGDGDTLAVGAPLEASGVTGIDGDQDDDGVYGAGAVYVLVRTGIGQWSQQAYVKASNTGQYDAFGTSVALSEDGSTLAVAAVGEASSAAGVGGDQADDSLMQAGAVYVFVRDGMGQWSQQAYVKASNPTVYDRFGTSLSISADGDTLAVGTPYEQSNATGIGGNGAIDAITQAGAAYVYVRDAAGAWSQQAYIKASNTGEGDYFGANLALAGDGDTLAVGARWEDGSATGIGGNQASDAASQAGAVYVFVRNAAGVWSQQAYVKASNTGEGDQFGSDVGLSMDGDTLAVGAPTEDGASTGVGGNQADDSLQAAGAAYVFVRDAAGVWSQAAYIKASNPDANDWFGTNLAVSGDGNTLAVATESESSDAAGIGGDQSSNALELAGAAYVFARDAAGTWSQRAYVKASNPGVGDFFGCDVSLSHDARTLAVGARFEDGVGAGVGGDQTGDGYSRGAVYLY